MRRRYAHSLALLCFAVVLIGSPALADETGNIAPAEQVGKAFTAVARKAVPAVVFIRAERKVSGTLQMPGPRLNDPFGLFHDDFIERLFPEHHTPLKPRRPGRIERSQGSGFVMSADGLILTNHHVVGEADEIKVRLHDGRELPAKLVGSDAKSDIALLRVKATGLPYLSLGDSDALEVGEWVVAIGNPFGLTETVTSGIVSAKGRTRVGVADYEDFIQTDAAINPGNSGGPLLNLRGEVVGINTAIYSRSGGYMGIGFAIPVNFVKSIEDQLRRHGKVERGFLGVVVQDVTAELARSFGLDEPGGALISDVSAQSPAARADLRNGDVILELNGKPVRGSADLRNAVAGLRPGTEAELLVARAGKRSKVTVQLGDQAGASVGKPSALAAGLGLEVSPLTRDLAARYGYVLGSGVVVTRVEPESAAARAGIRSGSLILGVDRTPVGSVAAFHKALAASAEDGRVLLRIRDGRFSRYVIVPF